MSPYHGKTQCLCIWFHELKLGSLRTTHLHALMTSTDIGPQLQRFWFTRSRRAWKPTLLTRSQVLLKQLVWWATLWQPLLHTNVREGMSAPPRMTHTVLKTQSVLPKRWVCQLSALWGLFSTLISRMRVFNPLSSAFLWRLLPRLMFSVLHITLNREMVSGLQEDSPAPRDDRVKQLDLTWWLYQCCQVQGCWQLVQGGRRSACNHIRKRDGRTSIHFLGVLRRRRAQSSGPRSL